MTLKFLNFFYWFKSTCYDSTHPIKKPTSQKKKNATSALRLQTLLTRQLIIFNELNQLSILHDTCHPSDGSYLL